MSWKKFLGLSSYEKKEYHLILRVPQVFSSISCGLLLEKTENHLWYEFRRRVSAEDLFEVAQVVFYDFGDRERIRTAGLPVRSVQRTSNNIERAGFPGFTFRS